MTLNTLIKLGISAALILILLLASFFIWFMWTPEHNSTQITSAGDVLDNVRTLVYDGKYIEANEHITTLFEDYEMDEVDTIRALNFLSTIRLSTYTDSMESYEMLKGHYLTLLRYLNDDSYSGYFQSSIMANIDRMFVESNFNLQVFNSSLKEFENGHLYKVYATSTVSLINQHEVAYRTIYDLNQQARDKYDDKFLFGFQVWLVSISVLESEPEDELRDEFMNYLVNGYKDFYDIQSYEIFQPEWSRQWLEDALILSSAQLQEKYPEDFPNTGLPQS